MCDLGLGLVHFEFRLDILLTRSKILGLGIGFDQGLFLGVSIGGGLS